MEGCGSLGGMVSGAWDPDTQLPLKLVGQEKLEGRGICFRNEDDTVLQCPRPAIPCLPL